MQLVLRFNDPETGTCLSSCVLPAYLQDDGTPRTIYGYRLPAEATTSLISAFQTWARHGNVHRGQSWNLGDEEDIEDGARGVVETIDYLVTEFDEGEEAAGSFGRNDGWGGDRTFDGIAWEIRADHKDAPHIIGAEED
jgi:hypothetical protein